MEKIKIHWLLLLALIFNTALSLINIAFPQQTISVFLFPVANLLFLASLPLLLKRKETGLNLSANHQPNRIKSQRKAKALQHTNHYPAGLLINHLPNFFCIKDAKGRWLQASPTYLELFNIKGTDYKGKTPLELSELPDINLKALRKSASMDKKAWNSGKSVREISTFTVFDEELTFELVRTPVYDSNLNKFRLFVTGHRIPQPPSIESKIFTSIFHSSHQAFLLFDSDFKIKCINDSFTRLTGFSEADALNQPISFLGSLKAVDDFKASIIEFFRTNTDDFWSGEISCQQLNGDTFPATLIVSPIKIDDKVAQPIYFFANIYDITQQKIDEQRIMQLAHFDDLTGLPNRVMFCDRLAQFLSAAKRHNLHIVVMFLDLDRFKSVNDSLGHQAGDDLLKEVAKRLLEQTRKEDIVARFSGDEFAVMLLNEQSHEKAIYSVSIVAQKIINELSEKFYIQRQDVFIGVSIGIAIYPEDASCVESILKHADIAMYEAKKQGRNNFQFFHKKFTAQAQDKRKMEVDMRKALQKDEFRIYFQPQFTADKREIWGAEVLIRWFQNQTKMIPPNYFIPIAEDTGLIIPIGTWILNESCLQLKQWLDNGFDIRQLSINISARQFMAPNFIDLVEQALLDSGLAPQYLEFEITESMLIGDIKKIELQLNRLKKMGIKIALDDFGTGYSSLSYLKNFPIDILKIDQSFIREMTPDSKDAQIACAIIDMGHSLGQKIVAEGVENETQFKYLSQKGCDIIQGYFFSPPLPNHEMSKLLPLKKRID
ncbi:MAG: EAL domain-containing protein [Gammaproteobacteria bacterium]